ncbi:Bud22 family protein [Ceratobasidium sp. AG-Ba]|nr:Bud22 family protein [Ceratobasidium sp. AG-Ba]QRW06759.1 Bud22 family protein [Ceratobasidium sp. AG-Ba]
MPGLKRKRGTPKASVELDEETLQHRVSGKLHHSFKEAIKAAKKAKTFEVQRTIKKLKEAKSKGGGEDILSLEKKLKMTKELDHATLARISLARKVQKIKALAIHPAIQSALEAATVPSLDSIHNDSKHALLSSKILAGEVDRLCTVLKDLVEPLATKVNEESEDKEADVEDAEEEVEEWKGVAPASVSDSSSEGSDSESDSGSDDSKPDPSALQSALSKLGIKLDASEPAPTPSSDSEDEDSVVLDEGEEEEDVDDQASWESGSIDSEGKVRRAPSVSSSDSSGSSPPTKRSKAESGGAGSRFLPSLATGFIRGDGSDIEDADTGPGRKNRRGQRARKAIWEKKYGKNANHVKKAREEAMAARGRGRGRGRGGRPGRGGAPNERNRGHIGADVARGQGGRVRPPPVELPTTQDGGWAQRAAKKADEKPMHPSWIAKQKLKEKESLASTPAQGKKIVFN